MLFDEFLIYDLETFGLDKAHDRIAQFAARRYDLNLSPLDDGTVLYCKLPEDYLPLASSVAITGITPDFVNSNGLCEAEFSTRLHSILNNNANRTLVFGYNNVEYDNKMVNYLLFRNFFNPYIFSDRTIDCFTLTRAVHYLKKDCLAYQRDEATGRDVLKLESLSGMNDLEHTHAHDALSDVEATAALAKKIKGCAPGLFDKYMESAFKAKNSQILQYSAFSHTPLFAVLPHMKGELFKCLDNNNLVSAVVVIASCLNTFYALNLLLPQSAFDDCLTGLREISDQSDDEIIGSIGSFTVSIKANEAPYIDTDISLLHDSEAEQLVESRLAEFNSVWKHPYIQKNRFAQSSCDVEKKEDYDASLYDGFIKNEAPMLIGAAQRNPAEIRALFKSVNAKNSSYSLRVKTLFNRFVVRNYPELLSNEAVLGWRRTAAVRLNGPDRLRFEEDLQSAKSKYADDAGKLKILAEVEEYGKRIIDKFTF